MTRPFPILGFLLATSAWAQGDGVPMEVMLKARAIKAAAFFTVFPPSLPPGRPWAIGFLGDASFGKAMETVIPRDTLMKGRPVHILYPKTRAEVEALDVLFIGASEKDRLPEVLKWVQGRPILTLGDAEGFFGKGTIVHLAMEDARVRPWVSLRAAQDAGLNFSSFFLSNAKVLGK